MEVWMWNPRKKLGIPELNHVSLHFITGWLERHHLISHFIDDFPKHRAFQFATFDCGYLKEHMINNFDSLTWIEAILHQCRRKQVL